MKSILKELYGGNVYPWESIVSKDPEYRPTAQKLCDKMERLKKKLSKGDYNRIEKLLDLQTDVSAMETEETFISAFKLGAMLMIEIFTMEHKCFIRE